MLACASGFAQTDGKARQEGRRARRPSGGGTEVHRSPASRSKATAISPASRFSPSRSLKLGASASKADFEAARDRLVACGAFENVSYRYGATPKGEGMAATFEVDEVEQVYPVDFQDLHVSSLDLDAVL